MTPELNLMLFGRLNSERACERSDSAPFFVNIVCPLEQLEHKKRYQEAFCLQAKRIFAPAKSVFLSSLYIPTLFREGTVVWGTERIQRPLDYDLQFLEKAENSDADGKNWLLQSDLMVPLHGQLMQAELRKATTQVPDVVLTPDKRECGKYNSRNRVYILKHHNEAALNVCQI
jgi:hypothetical protein